MDEYVRVRPYAAARLGRVRRVTSIHEVQDESSARHRLSSARFTGRQSAGQLGLRFGV